MSAYKTLCNQLGYLLKSEGNRLIENDTSNKEKIELTTRQKILTLMRSIYPRKMKTIEKIRIGANHDGGYVVPESILKCDSLLSIGVGEYVSFDMELATNSIKVYQFDHTVGSSPLSHPNFTFKKKGWGKYTGGDFLCFKDILLQFQTLSPKRPILQFDIEGGEYQVLSILDSDLLIPFEIIVCEIHWLDQLVETDFFNNFSEAIKKLTINHTPVHLHANNGAGTSLIEGISIPRVLELSFLRNDLETFDGFSEEPIPCSLDYPNDVFAKDIIVTLNTFIK